MNLDTLKPGQLISVQEASIIPGSDLKWTRTRGTRVFISSPRVHPRTRDIALSISGSGSYAATDWDQAIGALARGGKATKIIGITGPWREVRHPEHPRDSKKRLAVPIYREAERGKDIP